MSSILNITMNRGEWSEPYVLLKLLTTNKLNIFDENLNAIDCLTIKSIKVPNNHGQYIKYTLDTNRLIASDSAHTHHVPVYEIMKNSCKLLERIKRSTQTTFTYNELDQLWENLLNPRVKAGRSEKTDIYIDILDMSTGITNEYGFSIKSNLGGLTSLLNASQATNFKFKTNSIISNPPKTPKGLVKKIKDSQITHFGPINSTFNNNLILIHKDLPEILSFLLIEYYSSRCNSLKKLLLNLHVKNPLNYKNTNLYFSVLSDFLKAIAFGMTPTEPWSQSFSANGGMVIVKADGTLGGFFLPRKSSHFQLSKYLIANTKFDTASTSRHAFGEIYDDYFFNLNLLIRL